MTKWMEGNTNIYISSQFNWASFKYMNLWNYIQFMWYLIIPCGTLLVRTKISQLSRKYEQTNALLTVCLPKPMSSGEEPIQRQIHFHCKLSTCTSLFVLLYYRIMYGIIIIIYKILHTRPNKKILVSCNSPNNIWVGTYTR